MVDNDDQKLKEQGNALFQKQCYRPALAKYEAALKCVGNDDSNYRQAVLLSNQSNCHFELGNYETSIELARRCLRILLEEPADDDENTKRTALINKNQLRLARALFYRGSHDDDNDDEEILEPLQYLQTCSNDPAFEKRAAKLQSQMLQQKRRQREPQDVPPSLPSIHRASLLDGSGIQEYYVYGHDVVTSALGPGELVESRDRRNDPQPCSPPIRLEHILQEERDKAATTTTTETTNKPTTVSILFGGVGDARHVYATLCDFYRQWQSIVAQRNEDDNNNNDTADAESNGTNTADIRLHLTLNDIHPAAIARLVVVLEALQQLGTYHNVKHQDLVSTATSEQKEREEKEDSLEENGQHPNEKDCKNSVDEARRLAVLLQYVYFGVLLPPSVHGHLMEVIDTLLDTNLETLRCWIGADDSVWTAVRGILEYWKNCREGEEWFPTVQYALETMYKPKVGEEELDLQAMRALDPQAAESLQARQQEQKQMMLAAAKAQIQSITLDAIPPPLVSRIRNKSPGAKDDAILSAAKKIMWQNVVKKADMFVDIMDGKTSPGRNMDSFFLKETCCILPPNCHSADGPLYRQIRHSPKERRVLCQKAREAISSGWRVNRTFFDPKWTHYKKTGPDTLEFNPVADVSTDFLHADILALLPDTSHKRSDLTWDFFDFTSLFFWSTAHAIAELARSKALQIDLSLESVTALGRKIMDEPQKRLSLSYPVDYHRILISNIPDYIGMMSIFTEVMPLLRQPSDLVPTFLQANVLYNCATFQDYEQYIYSSTAVPSFDQMEIGLGLKYLGENSTYARQNQWTWSSARTTKVLAKRDVLTQWLHRLLLFSLAPPERSPYARSSELCSMNASTFLRACVHCVETLGYPRHWIGLMLDDILAALARKEGKMKTKASFRDRSPAVPEKNSGWRVVNLSAFQLDIECQLVIWTQHCHRTLMPLESLGNEKIVEWELALDKSFADLRHHGEDPPFLVGGNVFPMVLGVIVTPKDESEQWRDDALRRGSPHGHFFSCIQFHHNLPDQESHDHKITFHLPESVCAQFRAHNLILIRTDSWLRLVDLPMDHPRLLDCHSKST